MTKPCENKACRHPFQDGRYGAQMRVFNQLKVISGKPPQYRCSVCKTVRS